MTNSPISLTKAPTIVDALPAIARNRMPEVRMLLNYPADDPRGNLRTRIELRRTYYYGTTAPLLAVPFRF